MSGQSGRSANCDDFTSSDAKSAHGINQCLVLFSPFLSKQIHLNRTSMKHMKLDFFFWGGGGGGGYLQKNIIEFNYFRQARIFFVSFAFLSYCETHCLPLLHKGQKRQCYMTEIERMKATGQLSAEGPGPQGSLTISDIRLPLKRDFVTKIGTSHGMCRKLWSFIQASPHSLDKIIVIKIKSSSFLYSFLEYSQTCPQRSSKIKDKIDC